MRQDFVLQAVEDDLQRLVVDLARLEVADAEVDSAVKEIEGKLPPGMTLDDILKRENMDAGALRGQIALELKVKKLMADELKGATNVSEQEISDFYDKEKQSLQVPESVKARHILVAVDPKDDATAKQTKKAKADDLKKKLDGGADFAELAKANSDCPSKENGGDLGTFRRGEMDKAFEAAAFSQATNVVGPVVESSFGYHIIEVIEHNQERTMTLADSHDTIARFLRQKKEQETLQTLLETLKSKADIKQM